MRSFPAPRRIVRELIYGPEPVGKAEAAQLERLTHGVVEPWGLGGFPHYGMKGSPALSFSGYVATPQDINRGLIQMGASTNTSVQEYPALPGDQSPTALPQWLSDLQELEEGNF